MFKWFSGNKNGEERFLEILKPGSVAVLSASCCNPAASATDEVVLERVRSACASLGLDPSKVRLETVTDAKTALPGLQARLNKQQAAVVEKLTSLFMTNGLDVFPMLLINGELAFYGGAPEPAKIESKLREMTASGAAGVAANT